ncbi:MAG: protein kinase [Candidatus Manganitrophus sp.]|nr:protein kinase [Candidatus Manganitrophus sp.]MDC4224674.1 protein kinase [Candidatus Manganitrophus sp.]
MEKLLGEKQPRKAAALFGKYRLLRPLKRSPFLENYLAQEESPPHTTVVLKRLHPLVIHRTDWVSLFLDEAKQAATLWHPNILRIYDLGVIDGVPYFVQPYLFGKKLQTLLARSRSLPIPTGMALLLIRQLLEALQFSHGLRGRSGRPIAHGGLHPERIFIGYDGVVGIGDFGLGWLEDPRSAIRSRYRAPESISEKKGGDSGRDAGRRSLRRFGHSLRAARRVSGTGQGRYGTVGVSSCIDSFDSGPRPCHRPGGALSNGGRNDRAD